MNKLSVIIDHYLEVTGQGNENYKKHLRAAKELLVLTDGDIEKAKLLIDKTNEKLFGMDFSLYKVVKSWVELK